MFINKIKFSIVYWVISFLALPFFFGWFSDAASDLLRQIMEPSKRDGSIIDIWENVTTVWNNVFKNPTEIGTDGVGKKWSIIVRITRLLLILTIALSVTMILYNGMIYIIQTWQWKEWKSLMKNVILIVIWIFVSLFSVVIINLIQSIPTTLEKELLEETNNQTDNNVLRGKKMEWWEVWRKVKWLFGWSDDDESTNKDNLINEANKYFEDKGTTPYRATDDKWNIITDKDWNEVWKVKLEDWKEVDMMQAYLDENLNDIDNNEELNNAFKYFKKNGLTPEQNNWTRTLVLKNWISIDILDAYSHRYTLLSEAYDYFEKNGIKPEKDDNWIRVIKKDWDSVNMLERYLRETYLQDAIKFFEKNGIILEPNADWALLLVSENWISIDMLEIYSQRRDTILNDAKSYFKSKGITPKKDRNWIRIVVLEDWTSANMLELYLIETHNK